MRNALLCSSLAHVPWGGGGRKEKHYCLFRSSCCSTINFGYSPSSSSLSGRGRGGGKVKRISSAYLCSCCNGKDMACTLLWAWKRTYMGCVSRGGEGVLLTMTLARGRKGQNAMIVYKKKQKLWPVFGLFLPMYGLYKYQRRQENGDRWRYLALTVHRPMDVILITCIAQLRPTYLAREQGIQSKYRRMGLFCAHLPLTKQENTYIEHAWIATKQNTK